jgi:hypothetical protein
MKIIVFAITLSSIIIACSASFKAPYDAPKCGYHGQECVGGGCCLEIEVCGGKVWTGCPEGFCCASPNDNGLAREAPPHRQFVGQ